QEFVHLGGCGSGCGPNVDISGTEAKADGLVAVATSDGVTVDSGFGNAPVFRIYSADGDGCRLVRESKVDTSPEVAGDSHRRHIEAVVKAIEGCGTVIVREIGPLPKKVLSNLGVEVVVAEGGVEEAVVKALRRRRSLRRGFPSVPPLSFYTAPI
ncbi:MAG: hypothetical protein IJ856_04680, partial [Candidatus Methanomethylophilaceae archaeon]|nr:hypothetical protein [Candidatus Methanomethylophilaceae archaeon]